MIHHVSIPARDPRRVAEVLAEVMGGKCLPFGPLEGAFMAAAGDPHGTMIEVYPEEATLDIPADDDQVVFGTQAPPRGWPFHLLLSVPKSRAEVEAIGAREGWRAKTFARGIPGQKPFFHLIEFWVENRVMVEVAPPEMAAEYENFLKTASNSVMNDADAVRRMRQANMARKAG